MGCCQTSQEKPSKGWHPHITDNPGITKSIRSVCDEDIAGLLLDLSESLYTGDLEEIVRADIDLLIAADL